MCEYELDAGKIAEEFNKAVDKAKMGFEIVFTEASGSVVDIRCQYGRVGRSNHGETVLIKNVVNLARPHDVYTDIDENGNPVSHMWLNGIFNDTNPQKRLWRELQEGDILWIRGIIQFYGINPRKIGITSPIIMRAERNGYCIFSQLNHPI